MSRSNFSRLATVFAILLLMLPNVSMAGPGGDDPAVIFDFDGDMKSDLLLHKVDPPNVGLVQTQKDGSGSRTTRQE